MSSDIRAVFDCNTLLQALASPRGPAGECIQIAIEGEIRLFISTFVVDELRDVTSRPTVVRKLRLIPERVNEFIRAIEFVGTFLDVFPEPFSYSRDPDDARYVNLALAANAKMIVSRDRDLLDVMDQVRPEGRDFQKRFPKRRVLGPVELLSEIKAMRENRSP